MSSKAVYDAYDDSFVCMIKFYNRHKVNIMEPPIVKQRRKLLLEFINWRNDKDKTGLHIDAKEVDEFLKIKKKSMTKI